MPHLSRNNVLLLVTLAIHMLPQSQSGACKEPDWCSHWNTKKSIIRICGVNPEDTLTDHFAKMDIECPCSCAAERSKPTHLPLPPPPPPPSPLNTMEGGLQRLSPSLFGNAQSPYLACTELDIKMYCLSATHVVAGFNSTQSFQYAVVGCFPILSKARASCRVSEQALTEALQQSKSLSTFLSKKKELQNTCVKCVHSTPAPTRTPTMFPTPTQAPTPMPSMVPTLQKEAKQHMSLNSACERHIGTLCLRDGGQSCVNCVALLTTEVTRYCSLLDITVFCLTPAPKTPMPTPAPTAAPTREPTFAPSVPPTPRWGLSTTMPTPHPTPLALPAFKPPDLNKLVIPEFVASTKVWRECTRLCCLARMPQYKHTLQGLVDLQLGLPQKRHAKITSLLAASKRSLTELSEKVCIDYNSYWVPLIDLQMQFLLTNFQNAKTEQDCAQWASSTVSVGDHVEITGGEFVGLAGTVRVVRSTIEYAHANSQSKNMDAIVRLGSGKDHIINVRYLRHHLKGKTINKCSRLMSSSNPCKLWCMKKMIHTTLAKVVRYNHMHGGVDMCSLASILASVDEGEIWGDVLVVVQEMCLCNNQLHQTDKGTCECIDDSCALPMAKYYAIANDKSSCQANVGIITDVWCRNHCSKKNRYCPKTLCWCKGDLPEQVERDAHGLPIRGAMAGETAAAKTIAEGGTPTEVAEAAVSAAIKAGDSESNAAEVAGAAEAADIIARLTAAKQKAHTSKVEQIKLSRSPVHCKTTCCTKIIGEVAQDFQNGLQPLAKACQFTIRPESSSCEVAQGILVSCVHYKKTAGPRENTWNDAQCEQLIESDAPQCWKKSVRTTMCQRSCFGHIKSEVQNQLHRTNMDLCAVGVDRYLEAHNVARSDITAQVLQLNMRICSCIKQGGCR